MNLDIENRTALVLGGGGGLGRATAISLAREGVRVAIADIDAKALDATAAEIAASGGNSMSLVWNLAELDSIGAHLASVESELGPVDILVNITGGPPPTSIFGQETQLWESSFRSMVLSVIKIADRVVPGMCERKWGRVITSTSSGVIAPIPNLGLSNTLRSSLIGWSKTLATEVAGDGVTSNIVVPGRIGTQRIQFLDESKASKEGRSVSEVVAESVASIPARRYGNPEEYGAAITFLASEHAAYITGTTVRVDGGYIPSV